MPSDACSSARDLSLTSRARNVPSSWRGCDGGGPSRTGPARRPPALLAARRRRRLPLLRHPAAGPRHEHRRRRRPAHHDRLRLAGRHRLVRLRLPAGHHGLPAAVRQLVQVLPREGGLPRFPAPVRRYRVKQKTRPLPFSCNPSMSNQNENLTSGLRHMRGRAVLGRPDLRARVSGIRCRWPPPGRLGHHWTFCATGQNPALSRDRGQFARYQRVSRSYSRRCVD